VLNVTRYSRGRSHALLITAAEGAALHKSDRAADQPREIRFTDGLPRGAVRSSEDRVESSFRRAVTTRLSRTWLRIAKKLRSCLQLPLDLGSFGHQS
jgi:hypothetical protein